MGKCVLDDGDWQFALTNLIRAVSHRGTSHESAEIRRVSALNRSMTTTS
jgi:hypothetical protein